MKTINDSELKEILFLMLSYLNKICIENNIRYSLSGGTLLGAIRNKGFIPWDDDIDVFLPRPDFNRLIDLLKQDSRYGIFAPIHSENYYYSFAKLVDTRTTLIEDYMINPEGVGVYIDIFPIDGLPDEKSQRLRHIRQLRRYKKNYLYSIPGGLYYKSPSFIDRIAKFIVKTPYALYCKLVGTDYWEKAVNKLMLKYDFDKSNYVGYIFSRYGKKEVMPHYIFNSLIEVDFEGERFLAIEGYDIYLKSLYGNYMELPPVEERVPHHCYKAYWKG